MSAAVDSQDVAPETMPARYRIMALAVVAGLAVSVVRHGLETKWGAWGGFGIFLAWWFVHFSVLRVVAGVAGLIVTIGRAIFVGADAGSDTGLTTQDYVLMTALVAAMAIGTVSLAVT